MSGIDPRLRRRQVLGLMALALGAAQAACADDRGTQSPPVDSGDAGDVWEPDLAELPDVAEEDLPDLEDELGLDALLDETAAVAEAYFEEHERDTVAALSMAWLAEEAPTGDEEEVREALEPVFRRILAEDGETPEETAERLRGQIRREYVEADVVDVDGWTMAPTELALASILRLAE